ARAPLTAAATAPGQPAGALESAALAVGQEGTVLRYAPGGGWTREFLLSSSGAVSKPLLRGVAWPEPGRAHAVGDLGAMWLWRAETGLWERDPAAPVGFEKHLMGIAFAPSDPLRGYAVGKEGTILRYDKSWLPETVPDGFATRHFTGIAFAGNQAIVAAGEDLLVNDGAGWRADADAKALLNGARIVVVAGLPDGGAVAAGPDIVIERDSPSDPWRRSAQPLLGVTPVALAAYRLNGAVRALAAVQPQLPYPVSDVLPEVGPDSPPAIIPAFPLPADGYLVRETQDGWRDEQRTAYAGSSADRPVKSDPIGALLVDAGGEGWALGGWSGESDAAGRGNGSRSGQGTADRARVQTAAILRYATGAQPAQPPALTKTGTNLDAAVARFAVAGHAACAEACADLRDESLGPDRTLRAAKDLVAALAAQGNGPRMLLYTGGRLPTEQKLDEREAARFAGLLLPGVPAYAAPSAADTAEGAAGTFTDAFTAAPAPFGGGLPAEGVAPTTGAATARPGARTHYAFDSLGAGGTVRVVVIDNSAGSLADSDPHQNPPEPQLPWLIATLDEAKRQGVPSIVMGSRDLNTRFAPALNVATDGDEVAQVLVDHGASAYFFERPEENRVYPIPSGALTTIPSFGTGTLGYRSAQANTTTGPDSVFGDAGLLLAEVDTAKRDAATNRAPVTVRLLPIIDELTLQAVDGTLLRRSRPSLFQGLGRRPVGGDRWGAAVGGGDPQPPGSDPYTALPPQLCSGATCATRIAPEYEFTSSDPDIGDFVAQDPSSTNLRKPAIGPDDKVISDHKSGLFCPFNAGTTTITVKTGGIAYSAKVTVQAGSVQRPCGTRPLDATRFKPPAPATPPTSPPPPASVPADSPLSLVPPTPPPAAEQERERERREPRQNPPVQPVATPIPIVDEPPPQQRNTPTSNPPATPPPPASSFARPIPPGGAVIRVHEEKREEEVAPDSSAAAVAYRYSDHAPVGVYLYGLVVLAAFAGATLRLGLKRRSRGVEHAAVHTPSTLPYRRRRP
ncbi:hypothetical protein OJ997_34730, partial [Solirubrobacter phytolaccae]|nr:hypothetical protein [Solirubrobacter phytolaccae]